MTRWLIAALHLLALAIGMTGIWTRGSALAAVPDEQALRRAFRADSAWGVAAGLWLVTGLFRAFGGLEKGTPYYLGSHVFWTKMALFGLVFALELWPMIALIQWRARRKRGESIDFRRARLFSQISRVQAVLVVLLVFVATALARGIGR